MAVHISRAMRTQLLQLDQKLRQCGVPALPLLGNVVNSLYKELPFQIAVNSLNDFKAGLSKSPLAAYNSYEQTFVPYAQKPRDMERLLTEQNIINWDERIVFRPVHHSLLEPLKKVASNYGTIEEYPDYYLMHASNHPEPQLVDVPDVPGYTLGTLHTSHAEYISDKWDYTSAKNAEYFLQQIEHCISVAAFEITEDAEHVDATSNSSISSPAEAKGSHESAACHSNTGAGSVASVTHSNFRYVASSSGSHGISAAALQTTDTFDYGIPNPAHSGTKHAVDFVNQKPVAYCIASDDLSLISMYVSPEHRRKHLAEMVSLKLHRQMQELNFPTISFIHPGNIASHRLAVGCRFFPRPGKWHWLEFVPYSHAINDVLFSKLYL